MSFFGKSRIGVLTSTCETTTTLSVVFPLPTLAARWLRSFRPNSRRWYLTSGASHHNVSPNELLHQNCFSTHCQPGYKIFGCGVFFALLRCLLGRITSESGNLGFVLFLRWLHFLLRITSQTLILLTAISQIVQDVLFGFVGILNGSKTVCASWY